MANPERRASRVVDTTSSDVTVRTARMDRPLRRASLDPTYTDPHLEELVRVASDRARLEAQAQGYAAGWSEGRQAAAQKAQAANAAAAQQLVVDQRVAGQKMIQLLKSLSEAVAAARVPTMPEWAEVADTLAEGALRLAAAALGRELRTVDDATLTSVKAALAALAEPGQAVVHLNPKDAALVLDEESLDVRVISDPGVPAGSVLVLTPSQRLRHDLPSALSAAEAVLRA